ncbi:GTP cyclohydrolase [Rickettsiales endosymbiont of Paramecium tredecaurelia]|uniref:GTP cyclohydrolase I FolE n=1 Tax=Candidatus Sarmatiella mevalonica TaxID=2770581 RepID=UPI001921378C|nr:GTP cyclohydrolase I FolE [Candidatus Sarmatiella mevalonica]MBL3284448.1 GTP cyclohydrolase [Candidatus Sarmatiella mevalonica]
MQKKQITPGEIRQCISNILQFIGEDVNREGLQDTPDRVLRSYTELFSGYNIDLEEIFRAKFADVQSFSDVILLRDIEFTSMCEHHMLPFEGSVDIAYLPNSLVLGVSKLARIVDCFSKRLQIQEKMTSQIGNAIQDFLSPQGVAVRVRAKHYCMVMRGVQKKRSVMETYHYTGSFLQDKASFLNLLF